jgi:hypothetical protein
MVFTPLNEDKLNLKLLGDTLKNDNLFTYGRAYNDFIIELYNQGTSAKVLLYANGMINYIEKMNDVDFSSDQIHTTFNNCISLLKHLKINIEYAKNLGIFISGDNPNAHYEEYIHKFGQSVFKTPYYKDMNLIDDKKEYAVLIEEKPELSFCF